MYDLMIIGAGPGGYTAANKAAEKGMSVILFEKDKIGGTCLNRGCIPTKSLLSSSNLYHEAKNGSLYGISGDVSFDYASILQRKDDVVDTLRQGIIKSLEKNKVEIVYGKATIEDKNHISCNDEIYEGKNILIASGSVVALPPIERIENAITSNEILEGNNPLAESLIIIGGGVIGVEISQALSDLGCKVTIIEMFDHLLPNLDKDLGQRLAMFLKKKGIDIILSAQVSKIEKDNDLKTVIYKDKNGEEIKVSAKEVLVATGRKADVSDLCKEGFNLEIERGVKADEIGKTNIDNIFVIGDAKSYNIQLAHVAEAQGENIVDHICGEKLSHDTSVIPSGIYTTPEIACVGKLEKELKEQGIEYEVKKYLTGANGKCLIENSESGFVKVIVVDDVIVGGQIICPHATELIGELAIAVQKKMTLKDFAEVVHPHPTISEMLWNVVK